MSKKVHKSKKFSELSPQKSKGVGNARAGVRISFRLCEA